MQSFPSPTLSPTFSRTHGTLIGPDKRKRNRARRPHSLPDLIRMMMVESDGDRRFFQHEQPCRQQARRSITKQQLSPVAVAAEYIRGPFPSEKKCGGIGKRNASAVHDGSLTCPLALVRGGRLGGHDKVQGGLRVPPAGGRAWPDPGTQPVPTLPNMRCNHEAAIRQTTR